MPVERGRGGVGPAGPSLRAWLGPLLVVASLLVLVSGCSSDGSADAHDVDRDPALAEATPSEGCPAPDADLAAAGSGTVDSGGTSRPFLVRVPEGSPTEPRPLVMNIHGAYSSAERQIEASDFDGLAEREGIVVVAPQAERPDGQDGGIWQLGPDSRDVEYLFDLLDEVETRLCVDTARVYLTGFSQGGILTQVMSCKQPGRFAAIAPVAGLVDAAGCDDAPPTPILAVHGTDDGTIGFDGRIRASLAPFVGYEQGPSVPELTAAWAVRNGCAAEPSEQPAAADVERVRYECTDSPVELYVVDGGDHVWPDGDADADTFDASTVIWDFFAEQALGG